MATVPGEYMLAALISALDRFGVGSRVGLLSPEAFPAHRGGTGILVGCDRDARPGVMLLLEQMGCTLAREHAIGVEAHLAGQLRPAPGRVVYVSSADRSNAADTALEPVPSKRCATCEQVKPLDEFCSHR